MTTGEVLAKAGEKVTAEMADAIQNAAVPFVWIQTEEKNVKVLSNMMVDITNFVDCNPRELGITELVYYPGGVQRRSGDAGGSDPQECTRTDSEAYYEGRYPCFH